MFKDYMFLNFLSVIMIMIYVLLSVAFLTLLERKWLGYVQFRKGPNKISMLGIFQPFSDAIKLISKEMFSMLYSIKFMYIITPVLSVIFMLFNWFIYLFFTNLYFLQYSILYIFMLLSILSYFIIMMGWSSNSLYSILGSIRSVSQMISYEVSLFMIFLVLMVLSEGMSFMSVLKWQVYNLNFFFLFPLMVIFFVSSLMELNRTPMDFMEGESELVSGFNVEYFSGGFILIFLSEYGMILFMSYLMMLFFMNFMYLWMSSLGILFWIILIIFMRSMLPRMRYDFLMYLCWKIILPMILSYLFIIYGMKMFMSSLMS